MDLEKPKDDEDSLSESAYSRHGQRPPPAQGPHSARGQKNATEILGDNGEIENPVSKKLKTAEKGVLTKTNNSDSETVLPPPPHTKESVAGKGTQPGKSFPTELNYDCEHSVDCPLGRNQMVITSVASTTSPLNQPPTNPQQSTGQVKPSRTISVTSTQGPVQRNSSSPSPSHGLPRVGALMAQRDPLWGKVRSSTPRPRSVENGLGNGFGQKSEESTAPFGETGPRNMVKDTKQKPIREGKQINETVSGHSPKEFPSDIPRKTTKQPRTEIILPDEGGGSKPGDVIEPPPFPKATKPTIKKVTEKLIVKTKPTVGTPLRVTTRLIESPVVGKEDLKPEEMGTDMTEEKSDEDVIAPQDGGKKNTNNVGREENHGGKQIVPAETYSKGKTNAPPAVTNVPVTPNQVIPDYYVTVKLTMSWREFCMRSAEFKNLVAILFQESSAAFRITAGQVVVLYEDEHCGTRTRYVRRIEIVVDFYISDQHGRYSKTLTEMCFKAFKDGMEILRKSFDYKVS
jgi:hypothetical protein